MENTVNLNELRSENDQEIVNLKKSFMGGYDKKDVENHIELLKQEKENIVKGYTEQIADLQTSLSMMVRERDKFLEEKNQINKELSKISQSNQELIEKNKQLEDINEELTTKLEEYKEKNNLDFTVEEEIEDEELEEDEDAAVKSEAEMQKLDKLIIELQVENEELIKNCKSQSISIERLNKQILELTGELSLEKSTKKSEILNLQGEIHKKNVTMLLTKNSLLSNLNVLLKEVEGINVD